MRFFRSSSPPWKVDDFLARGVVIQRVHREITAPGVLLLRPEDVVAQHPAMLVLLRRPGVRAAKRRDLHGLAAEHHVHEAEAPPDDEGAAEERPDLLRARVGGHVEVFRGDAQEQVAHGAADDMGRKARLAQRRAHLGRRRTDGFAAEAVPFPRHPLQVFGGQPEHPPYEPLDH
jgi:hypothetical protein